ncbi:MAG: YigZ family protein [Methylococcaceae bacterium]|nr:YigZ family protein [Methylococcaceae bacterium]
MHCIKSQYSIEETIKKSRFIGIIFPCDNELEIQAFLRHLQSVYPDASHIAFAYRLKTGNGFISRMNDAGEPSGTAGKPIYQHLEGKDIMNAMLAVVRYFGGIKLGAGGLTRAYGNAAKKVIETAELFPYIEWVQQELALDYKELQSFEHCLKKLDGQITNQDFGEQIQLTVRLPKENLPLLSDQYQSKYRNL